MSDPRAMIEMSDGRNYTFNKERKEAADIYFFSEKKKKERIALVSFDNTTLRSLPLLPSSFVIFLFYKRLQFEREVAMTFQWRPENVKHAQSHAAH